MVLTGDRIIERQIIYNVSNESIQQQGVDLRVDRIFKVQDGGIIPVFGKTHLPGRIEVKPDSNSYWDGSGDAIFELNPGYYELELMEGCNIPNNAVLWIKGRSSIVRCGGRIDSGQFDGGFKTDSMGCYLEVIVPMVIERGARIAQAVVFESYPVKNEKLYNGQYQNDKQRK